MKVFGRRLGEQTNNGRTEEHIETENRGERGMFYVELSRKRPTNRQHHAVMSFLYYVQESTKKGTRFETDVAMLLW